VYIDPKVIDGFVARIYKEYKGQEVTVELVCNIAGRAISTAMNDLSTVPAIEQSIENLLEKIDNIFEQINASDERILKVLEHSDKNVKATTDLLGQYIKHDREKHATMNDTCRVETGKIIKEHLEENKASLELTITDTIKKVLKEKRENDSFWMNAIRWFVYVAPVLLGCSGVIWWMSLVLKKIESL